MCGNTVIGGVFLMNNNKQQNNKNTKGNNNVKKNENALMIGLYSVVAVLVITAGALTVSTVNSSKNPELAEIEKNVDVESSAVGLNLSNALAETEVGEISDSIYTDSGYTVETKNEEKETNMTPIQLEPTTENNEQNGAIVPKDTNENSNTDADVNTDDSNDSSDVDLFEDEETEPANSDKITVVNDAKDMYTAYSDNSKMTWPIVGDVVMNYSTDAFVYDNTLEQYRTNETMCIKSTVGANVVASTDGEVTNIASDEEKGNYVVVSHGNGWTTTYSQLDNKIYVQTGDIVKEGQTIGHVAKPTKYSVALGPHLGFTVAKESNTVNPVLVLK